MKNNSTLLILAIASIFVFTSCSKHDMWITIVYQTEHKQFEKKAGISTTLDECMSVGKETLQSLGLTGIGTFECGLNCKSDHPGIFLVCDKVVEYKGM